MGEQWRRGCLKFYKRSIWTSKHTDISVTLNHSVNTEEYFLKSEGNRDDAGRDESVRWTSLADRNRPEDMMWKNAVRTSESEIRLTSLTHLSNCVCVVMCRACIPHSHIKYTNPFFLYITDLYKALEPAGLTTLPFSADVFLDPDPCVVYRVTRCSSCPMFWKFIWRTDRPRPSSLNPARQSRYCTMVFYHSDIQNHLWPNWGLKLCFNLCFIFN